MEVGVFPTAGQGHLRRLCSILLGGKGLVVPSHHQSCQSAVRASIASRGVSTAFNASLALAFRRVDRPRYVDSRAFIRHHDPIGRLLVLEVLGLLTRRETTSSTASATSTHSIPQRLCRLFRQTQIVLRLSRGVVLVQMP